VATSLIPDTTRRPAVGISVASCLGRRLASTCLARDWILELDSNQPLQVQSLSCSPRTPPSNGCPSWVRTRNLEIQSLLRYQLRQGAVLALVTTTVNSYSCQWTASVRRQQHACCPFTVSITSAGSPTGDRTPFVALRTQQLTNRRWGHVPRNLGLGSADGDRTRYHQGENLAARH
jgi:hypothetical protein